MLDKKETHKGHWIRSLKDQNISPILEIKCVVEGPQEAFRLEIALIAALRLRGENLTNETEGGEGGIEAARKGGLACREQTTREQRCQTASIAGKASALARANWTPEQKLASIQKALDSVTPEIRTATLRKWQLADPERLRSITSKASLALSPEQRRQNGIKAYATRRRNASSV